MVNGIHILLGVDVLVIPVVFLALDLVLLVMLLAFPL